MTIRELSSSFASVLETIAFVVENIAPWALPAAFLAIWLWTTPSQDNEQKKLRRDIEIYDFLPPLGMGYFVLSLVSAKCLALYSKYIAQGVDQDGVVTYPAFPAGPLLIYALVALATALFIFGELSEELRDGDAVERHKKRRLGSICITGMIAIFLPLVI